MGQWIIIGAVGVVGIILLLLPFEATKIWGGVLLAIPILTFFLWAWITAAEEKKKAREIRRKKKTRDWTGQEYEDFWKERDEEFLEDMERRRRL